MPRVFLGINSEMPDLTSPKAELPIELEPEPSFERLLRAAFSQETSVGSFLAYHGVYDYQSLVERLNRGNTPIEWTPEKIAGTPFQGRPDLLVNIRTEEEYAALLQRMDKQQRDRQVLASASGGAAFLATTLAGFADPINLVPFGAGLKARTIARALARGAVSGALGNASVEAALQLTQEERTLAESLVSTAGGAVLGGVFGAGGQYLGQKGRALQRQQIARDFGLDTGTLFREVDDGRVQVIDDLERLEQDFQAASARVQETEGRGLTPEEADAIAEPYWRDLREGETGHGGTDQDLSIRVDEDAVDAAVNQEAGFDVPKIDEELAARLPERVAVEQSPTVARNPLMPDEPVAAAPEGEAPAPADAFDQALSQIEILGSRIQELQTRVASAGERSLERVQEVRDTVRELFGIEPEDIVETVENTSYDRAYLDAQEKWPDAEETFFQVTGDGELSAALDRAIEARDTPALQNLIDGMEDGAAQAAALDWARARYRMLVMDDLRETSSFAVQRDGAAKQAQAEVLEDTLASASTRRVNDEISTIRQEHRRQMEQEYEDRKKIRGCD